MFTVYTNKFVELFRDYVLIKSKINFESKNGICLFSQQAVNLGNPRRNLCCEDA